MSKKPETLKSLREKIRKEVPYVGLMAFSHNIISLVLQSIANEYGHKQANKTIRMFNLEELGWSEVDERSKR